MSGIGDWGWDEVVVVVGCPLVLGGGWRLAGGLAVKSKSSWGGPICAGISWMDCTGLRDERWVDGP